MQSYCAPHAGLCLNYGRRAYEEVYIGAFVVSMIFAGIPTCIGAVEFVLNYKFCQTYDEETDANVGGLTICECITWIFTCGKALQDPEPEIDEFMERYRNPPPIEDEILDAPQDGEMLDLRKKKQSSITPANDADKAESPTQGDVNQGDDEEMNLLVDNNV